MSEYKKDKIIKSGIAEKSVKQSKNKQGSPAIDKRELDVVTSLVEFLDRFIERKGKILALDKKVFDRIDRTFSEENKLRLVPIFLEKDKDLKYCITLSEFVLEGSLDSIVRLELLTFIERVVSSYSLFSNIKSNSIFQTWLDGCADRTDKLKFFEANFRSLSGVDKNGKVSKFSDSQVASLLCISAVWLYFKRESNFFMLIRYLSLSAFNTSGVSSNYIEAQAFGFAASMISSTKKKNFAYLLKMVSEAERKLSAQLEEKAFESANKTKKILSLDAECESINRELSILEEDKKELLSEVEKLKKDVSDLELKTRHRDIHHADSKDELRIRVKNILEGELKDVLYKAKKAHSKSKHSVVEYQLDDALEILERELNKVKKDD